jgi:hypothetical protein
LVFLCACKLMLLKLHRKVKQTNLCFAPSFYERIILYCL